MVWGGQLPSLQLELVIQNDFVDIASFGEGEETWAELLECIANNEDIDDVLKNWYIWKSFTNENAINEGKTFEFAKQTILS